MGSCEHGNEPSGSQKETSRERLMLLKKDSWLAQVFVYITSYCCFAQEYQLLTHRRSTELIIAFKKCLVRQLAEDKFIFVFVSDTHPNINHAGVA
jgi:hypothetical protein